MPSDWWRAFFAYNLRTRFFPEMNFSQNYIANYGTSFKTQKVMLPSSLSAFGSNFSCLPIYLDNKSNFATSGLVTFYNIWQNIVIQKIKKIHWVDPEKNVSQTDGQTDGWTNEEEWFHRTPSTNVFQKFKNKTTVQCSVQRVHY